LIPSSGVDEVLILRIAVKLGAVDAVGVAIVGSVTLLEFHHLLSFDLVVDTDDGLAAGSHEFGAVEGVVEAVELLIDTIRVVFESGKQFPRGEVPILDFSLCISSGEDVASLEVVILRTPQDVREGSFGIVGDGICEALLLDVEDLDGAVLAGCMRGGLPAARYLSWTSNLTE
jgi:hypothetical protein